MTLANVTDTIIECAKRDPNFRRSMLLRGIALLIAGNKEDVHDGKSEIQNYINATIGFPSLAKIMGIPKESLIRMLGPSDNPSLNDLNQVTNILLEAEGLSADNIFEISLQARDSKDYCDFWEHKTKNPHLESLFENLEKIMDLCDITQEKLYEDIARNLTANAAPIEKRGKKKQHNIFTDAFIVQQLEELMKDKNISASNAREILARKLNSKKITADAIRARVGDFRDFNKKSEIEKKALAYKAYIKLFQDFSEGGKSEIANVMKKNTLHEINNTQHFMQNPGTILG